MPAEVFVRQPAGLATLTRCPEKSNITDREHGQRGFLQSFRIVADELDHVPFPHTGSSS